MNDQLTPLRQLVDRSNRIGDDPSLVVYGGGNTSVKILEEDLYGDPVDVLYVKASGWDLVDIDATVHLAVVPQAHREGQ